MLVNLEEQLEFNQLSTFEMGLKMSLLGLDLFNRGILGVKILRGVNPGNWRWGQLS